MNKFLKGLGIIVGLMFGAGIFALPFIIAKAGIFWGTVHLLVAGTITILLLFLYAEVSYYTEGRHRFTGYVEIILGKKAKFLAFFTTILFYYGTLLAYGVLGGLFLSNFFDGSFVFTLSLLFFAVGASLILLKLEKVALVNFYLTIPLFGFIVYLLFVSLPSIDTGNFFTGLSFSFSDGWFLPYGIWLFALGAFAAIPETRDIFRGAPLRDLKKVILLSVLLCVLFYCLFILSITGVSGGSTSEDAFSGVLDVLGNRVILAGSIMGFLAVFTSFLSLGTDLRDIFRYDFGFTKLLAWVFVVSPPVLLFVLGVHDFTRILGLVGSLGIGVSGIFIVLMAHTMRKRGFLEIVVLAAILLAVAYEVVNLF